MSGRILDFKQYIGGADNVINVEMFPRDQKSFTYDFGFNVSSYTFSADYQSILLDTVTYDRATGNPNFADTNVIGYFDNYTEVNDSLIDESNESAGEAASEEDTLGEGVGGGGVEEIPVELLDKGVVQP